MATKTKPKKKTDPMVAQAQAYAAEKLGPQAATINSLFGSARDQFSSDIEAAKAAGESGKQFALAAIPGTEADYGQARKTAAEAAKGSDARLSTLSAAADPFKAAISGEREGSQTRLAGDLARATQNLRDRAVSAKAGEGFATNAARADYRKTKGSLESQLKDLSGQQGLVTANQLSALLQHQADLDNSLNIATGHDQTSLTIAGVKDEAAKKKQAEKDKVKADKDKLLGRDKYGNTRQQRVDRGTDFEAAQGFVASVNKEIRDPTNPNSKPIPKPATWNELFTRIVSAYPSVDKTYAKAVAQMEFGQLDPKLRNALIAQGIKVPKPARPHPQSHTTLGGRPL